MAAVEEGELHGERVGDADVDAGGGVLGEALAVVFVERAGFDEEAAGGAAVVGELLLEHLALAAEVAGDREAGLDGGEELGLFLDDLCEALFDEAVQDLIDLLPGDMSASGELESLELRVSEQDEVGARFVCVQTKLLQPSPEPLK